MQPGSENLQAQPYTALPVTPHALDRRACDPPDKQGQARGLRGGATRAVST